MSTIRALLYDYKRQCEIWMVGLGSQNIVGHEQKETRPFYVISSNEYNKNFQTPIGFFMSSSKEKQTKQFTYEINGLSPCQHYTNQHYLRRQSYQIYGKKFRRRFKKCSGNF